jgi:hypothetical protein
LYFNYKKKNRWRNRMSPYEILASEKNNIDLRDLESSSTITKIFGSYSQTGIYRGWLPCG